MAPLGSNVSNLGHYFVGQTSLELQIEIQVMGRNKVLGNGKDTVRTKAWRENVDPLLDRISVCGCSCNRIARRPARIPFYAVGSSVTGAIVEERIQVWSVIEQPDAGTNHRLRRCLVGNSYAGPEVSVDGIIQIRDLISLESDTAEAGAKDG